MNAITDSFQNFQLTKDPYFGKDLSTEKKVLRTFRKGV